jgi:hypothetical protein
MLLGFCILALGLPETIQGSESRPQSESTALAARTAAYFDPNRSGEGIFVELLPVGQALVYVFSYGPKYAWNTNPRVTLEPRQTWLVGVGQQTEWGIQVDAMLMPTGGRFGAAFDPDQVEYLNFGPLFFSFPACGTGSERGSVEIWAIGAPLEFQDLELDNYVQLSEVIDCESGVGSPNSHVTGSWYDPARPGEGLAVQVLQDGRAIVQWMTYDSAGGQMWIQGIGEFDNNSFVLRVQDLRTFGGSYWGGDFNPAEITSAPFGSLTIDFWNCAFARMTYVSLAYGAGAHEMERLTTPLHINDAGIGCWNY